jgi:hypothetical protein
LRAQFTSNIDPAINEGGENDEPRFVHGKRAESEAALHAALCEKSGDTETAETWRKLQKAVREVRPKLAA